MAISKERFIELVNQKAKVYGISKNKKVFAVGLKYKIVNDKFLNEKYEALKDFYEKKEDAEFALKFKNIQRIETLDLPTFEEFDSEFSFKSPNGRIITMELRDNKVITIESDYERFFIKPYTKPFYLLACCYCREIFLDGKIKESRDLIEIRESLEKR